MEVPQEDDRAGALQGTQPADGGDMAVAPDGVGQAAGGANGELNSGESSYGGRESSYGGRESGYGGLNSGESSYGGNDAPAVALESPQHEELPPDDSVGLPADPAKVELPEVEVGLTADEMQGDGHPRKARRQTGRRDARNIKPICRRVKNKKIRMVAALARQARCSWIRQNSALTLPRPSGPLRTG